MLSFHQSSCLVLEAEQAIKSMHTILQSLSSLNVSFWAVFGDWSRPKQGDRCRARRGFAPLHTQDPALFCLLKQVEGIELRHVEAVPGQQWDRSHSTAWVMGAKDPPDGETLSSEALWSCLCTFHGVFWS